jgi:hypothetical protein
MREKEPRNLKKAFARRQARPTERAWKVAKTRPETTRKVR